MDCSATPLTRIAIALIVPVTNVMTKTSIIACRPCSVGLVDLAVP